MHNPANLRVLERAVALVIAVHKAHGAEDRRLLRRAPGLCGQLLRSASSIAANISEGTGQQTAAQFARYLAIAIGSANETEHQLRLAIALDLFVIDGARFVGEVGEIRRMLHGLRTRVIADGERGRQQGRRESLVLAVSEPSMASRSFPERLAPLIVLELQRDCHIVVLPCDEFKKQFRASVTVNIDVIKVRHAWI